MPELPDIQLYLDALDSRVVGQRLESVRLKSPFVLRSVDPPISAIEGLTVRALRRIGKRIVLGFADAGRGEDLFLVVHLMIAGRFQWKEDAGRSPGKILLAEFQFAHGRLLMTEAASRKRASIHVVRGEPALCAFDRGGLEVLGSSFDDFRAALTRENHTLKRALTDPRILSGIGNAYSDEILHRAKQSPFRQTRRLDSEELHVLHAAVKGVLDAWIVLLRDQAKGAWPKKVTAFRSEMAVHGKYGEPCPVCGDPVQRILYAENEANYCATCQTGGKLLADRVLSKLLKDDWPKTLDELEERRDRLRKG